MLGRRGGGAAWVCGVRQHKAARASFKERKKLRDAIAAAERASSVLSVLPGPCTGDKKEKAVRVVSLPPNP